MQVVWRSGGVEGTGRPGLREYRGRGHLRQVGAGVDLLRHIFGGLLSVSMRFEVMLFDRPRQERKKRKYQAMISDALDGPSRVARVHKSTGAYVFEQEKEDGVSAPWRYVIPSRRSPRVPQKALIMPFVSRLP